MSGKKTMTLNLTNTEMVALEALCAQEDISKTALIRKALRLYQLVQVRVEGGEKLYFENEDTKDKAEIMLI